MSFNVQNKINFRAQNDNIISAPQTFENQVTEQPVDEEKSNAAKWMIGLTATAAIVVGGLWAAKRGHLGESAQKYANKLLGSATDAKGKGGTTSTSSSTSASTTSTSTSTGATTSTASTVAAVIPALVVARKSISKLIKSPKNFDETIQGLRRAGIEYIDNSGLLLEAGHNTKNLMVKTGKKATDFTYLNFDENGILTHIFRPLKENAEEVFEFNNGSLKSITRNFDGLKTQKLDEFNNPIGGELISLTKPLKQTIEFDKSKKVVQEAWEVAERGINEELTLTSVKGLKDSFYSNGMSGWKNFLNEHYDDLPPALKKAKIFQLKEQVDIDGGSDTAQYLTARVAKYWKKPLKDIPQEIPSEEFARFLYKNSDPHFTDVVNTLNVERNIARRVSDVKIPIENDIEYVTVHSYAKGKINDTTKIQEKFKEIISSDKTGRKAEVFAKLFKDDLGPISSIYEKNINAAILSYNSKFKAYGLDGDIELMEISAKPLKECSYDDVMKIVRHRAPQRAGQLPVVADDFKTIDQEQKAVSHLVEIVTGRKNIDSNTKLFDLLQDIS